MFRFEHFSSLYLTIFHHQTTQNETNTKLMVRLQHFSSLYLTIFHHQMEQTTNSSFHYCISAPFVLPFMVSYSHLHRKQSDCYLITALTCYQWLVHCSVGQKKQKLGFMTQLIKARTRIHYLGTQLLVIPRTIAH